MKKILVLLSLFGCTMTNTVDRLITDNFDCFELKNNNGNGSIYLEANKNLKLYEKGELVPLSMADSKFFVNYYPDAMPLYEYYTFSAFISEDKKLEILLFCEYNNAENTNNFIIQSIYDKKPVANFSLTEIFGLEKVKEFEGIVTIADGFSGLNAEGYFKVDIFKIPKGTTDEYGTININKTGEISLFTGSGTP